MKAHPPRVRLGRMAGLLAALWRVAAGPAAASAFRSRSSASYASRRLDQFASPALADAFLNSLMTASFTALLTVVLALFLLNAVRLTRSPGVTATVRLASVGYALPGGILGLGLLFALARFDNTLDALRARLFRLLDRPAADRLGRRRRPRLHDPLPGAGRRRDPVRPGEAAAATSTRPRAASASTPAQSARIVLLPLLRRRS